MTLPALRGGELERARWLVGEVRAALEFHFADGVTDENDHLFARTVTEHEDDPAGLPDWNGYTGTLDRPLRIGHHELRCERTLG